MLGSGKKEDNPCLVEFKVICRDTDLLIRKKWQDMVIDETWEMKEKVNQR